MSSRYRLVRKRWASKEMRVLRWIKGGGEYCRHDEPLCVVSIDGTLTVLPFLHDEPPVVAGIYYTLVEEGSEVGPDGGLIEYQWGRTLADTELHQTRLDLLGLRPPPVRLQRRATYNPIFMSYRRDDSEAYAGRLHESLERELGSGCVFMDMFGTQPGDQYEWAIQQAAAHARAMVVLIGPRWMSIERDGVRRLTAPGDLLAREVAAALDRRIPVFPVYVGRAPLITRMGLPTELTGLEMCQAFELTGQHWSAGIDELSATIRRAVDLSPVPGFTSRSVASREDWADYGALSQALLAQPSLRLALVKLAQDREPDVSGLLAKFAAAENDSETRRLVRWVLNSAGVGWPPAGHDHGATESS